MTVALQHVGTTEQHIESARIDSPPHPDIDAAVHDAPRLFVRCVGVSGFFHYNGTREVMMDFSDNRHNVAELAFQGASEIDPQSTCKPDVMDAMATWSDKPDH